ncbi:hypothetical protein IscW_ISCW012438 [Ixodes scapularis]|uniref:Secreted protein n=1 Tax=Ixodes scapularis TaxID=6945 RepID=B7QAA0_IXOSC|nr:hypothetical protein IscW_ISCW012438 [Ixodes scapularis]|eukprot:XP_002400134.1 hypothetical protein IscW_ISCW012438 [Ixodes scapularis]
MIRLLVLLAALTAGEPIRSGASRALRAPGTREPSGNGADETRSLDIGDPGSVEDPRDAEEPRGLVSSWSSAAMGQAASSFPLGRGPSV